MSLLATTSLSHCIEVDWTDEQLMLFLGERKSQDPLPSNVITEVNPFSIDPWNAPDKMWYLYHSDNPNSPKREREIKDTAAGYWKEMGHDLKIFTGTQTVGRKVTWKFYGGAPPFGDKIGWMMFEYKLEQKEFQGIDKAQDFNALCRIFWHNIQTPDYEAPHNPVGADDADGDYLQSVLMSMLDHEEGNHYLLEPTDGSQVVYADEKGLLAVSDRSLQDSRHSNSTDVHVGYAAYDFPSGDFLELKDFYDLESSSSSSDNSSCMSRSSDEYFDSEALLQDLENENSVDIEERHIDCKFSVSRSLRTNRVVIQPPPPGSVCNNGNHMLVGEGMSSASAPGSGWQLMNPAVSSSTVELPLNGIESIFGPSEGNNENGVLSRISQTAGTSRVQKTNRVGRIAKLGKKYFCFASF